MLGRAGLIMGVLMSVSGLGMGLEAGGLRCEYRENPLGIEVRQPRLTWLLASEERGARQTAYQILVAGTPEDLAADRGTLWDSGKVESDETALISYGGAPLGSRAQCHWKVRVWDGGGRASAWSAPAYWTMGLLAPGDWTAQWIGYDAPAGDDLASDERPPARTLEGASWIWYPEGNPKESAPAGKVYLRKVFELPGNLSLRGADVLLSVDNSCRVFVNGQDLNPGGAAASGWQQIHQFSAQQWLFGGRNIIAIEAENTGSTANPAGVIAKLVIQSGGDPVVIATDATWKAQRGDAGEHWNQLITPDEAWPSAQVIALFGEAPWGRPAEPKEVVLPPPPYLRKEFETKGGVKRATVYASALGLYELYLNGLRVGEEYLTPGWTEFRKRVHYLTHDVTDLVRADSANALGAILADGWYAGYLGFLLLLNHERPRNYYGGEPRLLAQLEIEYEDGSTQTVGTDGTWKAAYGPILEADLLMGEVRDLRRVMPGWAEPGFDDGEWSAPAVTERVEIPVEADPGDAVRKFETIPAVSVKEQEPGVFIYDFGQNLVGWVRMTAKGAPGQKIQVRHAERLDDDGALYLINLRKARAVDTYYLSGAGEEVLEPAFTFHGFQYAEITGIDEALPLDAVQGIVLHSAIEQAGHFECSEPLLNQLFHNIVWGQKGNYLEVPTDCPQRDERMGWTGDAQFFMPTSAYVADVGAFFTKWLVDLIQDSQMPDGAFAHVAPNVEQGGGAVAWGDAAMICTYEMYRYYGDTRVIEQHYDNLVKGMEFLENTSENFIRKNLGFGDWLNLGGGAKDEVICTAYFAYLAELMSEMGEVIGREADAKRYATLAENVRRAFIESFIADDGKILDSSQTGYALAFTMGLVPDNRRELMAQRFVEEIERFDGHLATGFIGTPRLLPALSAANRRDVAYRLLMNTTYPSWLFQVTLGATTMWERWDGWTPDKGFQDPGMNSFNHYAFGAVGEWLFSTVGGIQGGEPGFRKVRIALVPGGGLTWAKTRYRSIRGEISTSWTLEDGQFTVDIVVPPNVEAEIHIPAANPNAVRADGASPGSVEGLRVQADGENALQVLAGAGRYRFTSQLPE